MTKTSFSGGLFGIGLFTIGAVAGASEVSRTPFGVTTRGEAIDAFTLQNERGMSVRIVTYGGIINELRAPDRNGKCENVVLSLPNLRAHENRANFSSLLGR